MPSMSHVVGTQAAAGRAVAAATYSLREPKCNTRDGQRQAEIVD
jgi:hypothetical protein